MGSDTQCLLELSIQNGCLLRGNSVIVSKEGQEQVLQQLHNRHPGISRMEALARSIVWWPGIDKEIETIVQNCTLCQTGIKWKEQLFHMQSKV
jgi:hypothetical protein